LVGLCYYRFGSISDPLEDPSNIIPTPPTFYLFLYRRFCI
jgi:hypothetical protein